MTDTTLKPPDALEDRPNIAVFCLLSFLAGMIGTIILTYDINADLIRYVENSKRMKKERRLAPPLVAFADEFDLDDDGRIDWVECPSGQRWRWHLTNRMDTGEEYGIGGCIHYGTKEPTMLETIQQQRKIAAETYERICGGPIENADPDSGVFYWAYVWPELIVCDVGY